MKKPPLLSINEYGYYEARWRESGVTMRRSMHTKDAETARREFARFLLRNEERPSYTVAQSWHLREHETLHLTADPQRIRDAWKALLPQLGHLDVDAIKPEHVNSYVTYRLGQGRKSSTIRRELVELTATLNHMATTKRIDAGRLPTIALPPESAARPHYLSDAQCAQVFSEAARRRTDPAVATRLEIFLWIAAHTGQRKRAIEQLEWSQVDMARGVIHFQKEGARITKKRKASVPMRAELQAFLAAERDTASSDWVLRHPGSVRTSLDNFMQAMQLPHVTAHVLRHTFVSQLLMREVPVYTVSKLAAVSVKRIELTYGHLSDEHLRAALAR